MRHPIFKSFMIILTGYVFVFPVYSTEFRLTSPNEQIQIHVNINDRITYSVFYEGMKFIQTSPISLTFDEQGTIGKKPILIDHARQSQNGSIRPIVPLKEKIIKDQYNELIFHFKGDYSLIVRAYDDGVAYRFSTSFSGQVKILSEEVGLHFAGDYHVYFPSEDSFISHFERIYEYIRVSEIGAEKMCSLPALIEVTNGPKVLITESDLEDYPGMFLHGDNTHSLFGRFPHVPLDIKPGRRPDRSEIIEKRTDYIARTEGKRVFPWRVLVIAEKDGDLLSSELVFKLAKPNQLKNTSWIKPGKVAWDWWNANNIYSVNFRAGINTETYKTYIDFASQYHIDYVILDEGWSETMNVIKPAPDIDIEEICRYAHRKDVGIILWVLWKPLDAQLQEALDQYEKWGVKGIKVDFMQRDDQWMVNYYHRIAREAARRKMIVDFHGAYKPCGLRRAYPNVLTREGVKGLENSKWSDDITPEHNVTLPFIRMVAGPMDYTPGAMINAQRKNFRHIFDRPMSMGTRCHQLAMYIIYESPLQMLCDSPSNYLKELECMEFLSMVPTVWDETVVLEAKIGDYIIVARRRNDDWYIGSMTDWSSREFEIELNFLEKEHYRAILYADGINADRYASDYMKIGKSVSRDDKMKIKMAPGGGWVAQFIRE